MFRIEMFPTLVRLQNDNFWVYKGKRDHQNCKRFLSDGYKSSEIENRCNDEHGGGGPGTF